MNKQSKFITILKWGALLGAGLSLIKLLSFFGESIDYEFGPVVDLATIVFIILMLYMGIKEIRDKHNDGLITFPKAFGFGACVAIIGGAIAFGYYLLHFNVIEKDGIEKVNRRNIARMTEVQKKDTITTAEIRQYCTEVRKAVVLQETHYDIDTADAPKVDSGLMIMMDAFERQLVDRTERFTLDSFNFKAEEILHQITTSLPCNADIAPESIGIVNASYDKIHEITILDRRMEMKSAEMPPLVDNTALALSSTFNILFYGIFLNIFVALFLYRKENANEPEENPESEEVTENEPEA